MNRDTKYAKYDTKYDTTKSKNDENLELRLKIINDLWEARRLSVKLEDKASRLRERNSKVEEFIKFSPLNYE